MQGSIKKEMISITGLLILVMSGAYVAYVVPERGIPALETFWTWFSISITPAIYFDAVCHKIGKVRGDKSFSNMSAGWWAIPSIFGIVITCILLAVYIFNRKKLIEKAKQSPVALSALHAMLTGLNLVLIKIFLSVWTIPTSN